MFNEKRVRNAAFISIVLASAVAAFVFFRQSETEYTNDNVEFSGMTVVQENGAAVKGWRNPENEKYYFFLSSDFWENNGVLSVPELQSGEVFIENVKADGRLIKEFQANQEYSVKLSSEQDGEDLKEAKVIFLQERGIPSVYITTDRSSLKELNENQNTETTGNILVFDEIGRVDYCGELASMKGRGNTSWEYYDKKPYNICLKETADLLGMGEGKNWALLTNTSDLSYLKNWTAFELARRCGLENTPDSRFLSLYVNGEYLGLYQLTEKIEIARNRIELAEGCLIEQELPTRAQEGEKNVFVTNQGQTLNIHQKKGSAFNSKEQIQSMLQEMEVAIYEQDEELLREKLDIPSWVRVYLVEEMM